MLYFVSAANWGLQIIQDSSLVSGLSTQERPFSLWSQIPLFKIMLTLAWIAWDLSSFPYTSPTTEVKTLVSRKPEAALTSCFCPFQLVWNIHHRGILVGLSFTESQRLFATLCSWYLGDHKGRCHCWGIHLPDVGSSNSSCYFLFESSSPK